MSSGASPRLVRVTTALLVVAVMLSAVVLAWLGYRAVYGWQQSAAQVAMRRASETAELLAGELSADMHGVQSRVLSSPQWDEFVLESPYDVINLAASAFARYPYPESFFVWRAPATTAAVAFLDRYDRSPPWSRAAAGPSRFPVVVRHDPEIAARIVARIEKDIRLGRRFSTFETTIRGTTYQVVARVLYRDVLRDQPEGVFGFTVNLAWARQTYFPDLTAQVARIGGLGDGLAIAILDDAGAPVVGQARPSAGVGTSRREFPLLFFEPQLVSVSPPDDQPRRSWAVAVNSVDDPTVRDATRGGQQTLLIAAFAALVLGLGVALTIRATRASARLAELRSEFVSSVTHELKTPIATIRAAGDTMARGRVSGPDALRDYAQIVVQEARRLTRLVDNLLAYSRITDVTEAYAFTSVDVRALMDDVLQGFRVPLSDQGFEIRVDVPADLPAIRADRTAALLLFDNLVDNAIRYSDQAKWLEVRCAAEGADVVIEVADRGRGIPEDELGLVTRRFFRGRSAGSGGSGLGLAIASRIVADHRGRLSLRSAVGTGTTVTVRLPAMETARG